MSDHDPRVVQSPARARGVHLTLPAALLAAATIAGCRCGGTGGGPCDTVFDCQPGHACIEGRCRAPEYSDSSVLPDVDGGNEDPGDGGNGSDGGSDSDATTDGGGPLPGDGGVPDILDGGAGGPAACLFVPPPGLFSPAPELVWRAPPPGDAFPNHIQAVATPTVVNLTDDDMDGDIDLDDVPDIIFISYDGNVAGSARYRTNGVIRVISGRPDMMGNPVTHMTLPIQDPVDPRYDPAAAGLRFDPSTSVALGDLDGDLLPEMVAPLETGPLAAFDTDGSFLWQAVDPTGTDDYSNGGAPTIADLDGDGYAEVVYGHTVIDGATGVTLWIGIGDVGRNIFGPQGHVVDLDGFGRPEVVAGANAYRADGTAFWDADTLNGGLVGAEGVNAVADMDLDGDPDVIIVRSGEVHLVEGLTGIHAWTFSVGSATVTVDDNGVLTGLLGAACAGSGGGDPTVADFDGDGFPEIALANDNCYVVVNHDGTLLWASRTEDDSSEGTGSSVFDFEGDGPAEVIYNDEHWLRIYAGIDGTVLFIEPNSSRTRHEYPIIVDVDNDGNAEIVFITNNESGIAPEGDTGIEVWGDTLDFWVPTRRIWNQHSYHITNVDELGGIPVNEAANWLLFNNYRTNLPDFDVFAAPDLTAEILDVDTSACNAGSPDAVVTFRICNEGDAQVGPGVSVAIYLDGSLFGTVVTTLTLNPGQCELFMTTVTPVPSDGTPFDITVVADDDGTGVGANNECDETNNADAEAMLECSLIG